MHLFVCLFAWDFQWMNECGRVRVRVFLSACRLRLPAGWGIYRARTYVAVWEDRGPQNVFFVDRPRPPRRVDFHPTSRGRSALTPAIARCSDHRCLLLVSFLNTVVTWCVFLRVIICMGSFWGGLHIHMNRRRILLHTQKFSVDKWGSGCARPFFLVCVCVPKHLFHNSSSIFFFLFIWWICVACTSHIFPLVLISFRPSDLHIIFTWNWFVRSLKMICLFVIDVFFLLLSSCSLLFYCCVLLLWYVCHVLFFYFFRACLFQTDELGAVGTATCWEHGDQWQYMVACEEHGKRSKHAIQILYTFWPPLLLLFRVQMLWCDIKWYYCCTWCCSLWREQ